jgi:hypothetical protein
MDGPKTSIGIMECWKNGIMGYMKKTIISMFFSIKPIIPVFHCSDIPAERE